MAEKFLKQYEIFYKKAKIDLKVAQNILRDLRNGDDDLDFDTVYFHLQQAAEKLLKSILSFYEVRFPKIHDIAELLELFKENKIAIILDAEILLPLSYYAVSGRYMILTEVENPDKYIDFLIILTKYVSEILLKIS